MDLYVTELMPIGSPTINTDAYVTNGHPVIVGVKGLAIGRGQHDPAIKISTEDTRRRHGQWKIFDMSYDHTVLVQESIVNIRAAD